MSYDILKIILIALAAFLALSAVAWVLVKRLSKKEPYSSFMRLPTRRKIWFLKAVITDKRVPWTAKALIPLTVLYLAMPFDLIPDFVPVLGAMDDILVVLAALGMLIRLCPRDVLDEHLQRAASS